MSDAPQVANSPRRWFRPTPDRVVLALLAVEAFLILSEWFGWFPFNRHKGWALVIGLAVVIVAVLLMFLWFLAALIFRWRFQYSIRSLFVLTLVVAVACSWLAVAERQARKQREVVESIKKAGFIVNYDDGSVSTSWVEDAGGGVEYVAESRDSVAESPRAAWLRRVLGDEVFVNVTVAFFTRPEVGDAELERLKELNNLEALYLWDTKVGDGGLARLTGLTQLRKLSLRHTSVSDAGLRYLKGLTHLERLDLTETRVTAAGVRDLKRALPNTRIYGL